MGGKWGRPTHREDSRLPGLVPDQSSGVSPVRVGLFVPLVRGRAAPAELGPAIIPPSALSVPASYELSGRDGQTSSMSSLRTLSVSRRPCRSVTRSVPGGRMSLAPSRSLSLPPCELSPANFKSFPGNFPVFCSIFDGGVRRNFLGRLLGFLPAIKRSVCVAVY